MTGGGAGGRGGSRSQLPLPAHGLRTEICAVASRPDVAWAYALRFQDLAAGYDLDRPACRVEGGRRHRAVRVGLDLRPLLSDLFRQHRPLHGGLDYPDGAGPGDVTKIRRAS